MKSWISLRVDCTRAQDPVVNEMFLLMLSNELNG